MGGEWYTTPEGRQKWRNVCDDCGTRFESPMAYGMHRCAPMEERLIGLRADGDAHDDPQQALLAVVQAVVADKFAIPHNYIMDAKKRRLHSVAAARHLTMHAYQAVTGCKNVRIAELMEYNEETTHRARRTLAEDRGLQQQVATVAREVARRLRLLAGGA